MQATVGRIGAEHLRPEHLGRLRRRRLELALTQSEVARHAGISKQTVSRLERSLTEPRPGTLAKLARVLDCQPIDLLDPVEVRLISE